MAKGKVYISSYPDNPPNWYWVDGLHDACIESVECFEFPFDYNKYNGKKNSYDRNLMLLRINASSALFDQSVKEIKLFIKCSYKSETGKDNFIFQRSINNLTLELLNDYNIDNVKLFVTRDKEHALMCVKNKDNTYTVIYKKEKTELSQDYPFSIYKCCKNIILPNSITKINLETFKNCIGLENITLPNSISEIGNKVFFGCTNLKTAPELPATTLAESCYRSMFDGCSNLERMSFHDDSYVKDVVSMDYMFRGTSMRTIDFSNVNYISEDIQYEILYRVKHNSYAENYMKEHGYNYKTY